MEENITYGLEPDEYSPAELEEAARRKSHDHCWHLGCILPRVPATIVLSRCGSAKAPAIQDLQVTPGVAGHIQFEGGLCLTSRGATKTASGDATVAPCTSYDPNQQWTVADGVVRSARTDCAGATAGNDACCLSISGANKAPGTIVQLVADCSLRSEQSDGFHLAFPRPGMKTARLVSNASGLCLTSGAGGAAANSEALIRVSATACKTTNTTASRRPLSLG